MLDRVFRGPRGREREPFYRGSLAPSVAGLVLVLAASIWRRMKHIR